MTQEQLQKLLDEFSQSEIAQTPQWKIDNGDRLRAMQKEASKLGGKVGGKVSGRMNVESGHLQSIASKGGKANTKEQLSAKGKIGGPKTKELGFGIHGLTDEQRKINASKGGKNNSREEMSRKNSLRKYKGHPPTTPILVLKDDNLIKEYKSISECARDMNLDKGNISKVVKGNYKQYKGYVFKKKP